MNEMTRSDNLAQVSLPVQGMTCAACVAKVEKVLKNLAGVQEVHVNLLVGKAAVAYASDQAGVPQMVKAIQEIGYEVPEEEILLTVRGMTCSACVAKVEKAVKGLPGVTSVVVNLLAESAKVKFYPGALDKTRIKKEINALGYEASEKLIGQEVGAIEIGRATMRKITESGLSIRLQCHRYSPGCRYPLSFHRASG